EVALPPARLRNMEVGQVMLNFSDDVTGVDPIDFVLTRNGGPPLPLPLAGGVVTPDPDDSSRYMIDLSAVMQDEGTYVLTLVAAESGIESTPGGRPLLADASVTWTLDKTAPVVDIIDITPDPRSTPVTEVGIEFNEAVTGFDISDVTLTRNGGPGDDLVAAGVVLTQLSGSLYTLNLSGVTTLDGNYELRVNSGAVRNIRDIAGNLLVTDGVDNWTTGIDTAAPNVDIIDITPDPRTTQVGTAKVVFNEEVTGVDVTDFTLTRDGVAVDLVTTGVTVARVTPAVYVLSLSAVTAADGQYVLTLNAAGSGIQDLSGNALATNADDDWLKDTSFPTADIVDVAPDPRINAVTQPVRIVFSQAVTGVDINDLVLLRNGKVVSLAGVPLRQIDPQTYELDLHLLPQLTAPVGEYELRLLANPSITSATTGRALQTDVVDTWTVGDTIFVGSMLDTVDANPGDGFPVDSMGVTTLRAAIMEANAFAGTQTIVLGAGTFTLTRSGRDEDLSRFGDLDIRDNLRIVGAGAGQTIIDAAALDRVLHIFSDVRLELVGVTVRGGRLIGNDDGAGVRSSGIVEIRDSLITANVSDDDGGGINNSGTMTIVDSTISANIAQSDGGGIRNSGTLTIIGSTVSGNEARQDDGGGLHNIGSAQIGGTSGTATIINSTFSGNTAATSGGGIHNTGEASLINATITKNTAGQFGGGVVGQNVTSLKNTIIVGNAASSGLSRDVNGSFDSQGNNIIGNVAGATGFTPPLDIVGVNPDAVIDPLLRDNGGPTL
ncbi:MAG: hypothetical protein ACREIV_02600, partial [Planctomycetaceae bacterium]